VTGAFFHALLWHGDAAGVIDLHPTAIAGMTGSEALATNGATQVGYGQFGSGGLPVRHALLWEGTSSALDLHTLLPAGFVSSRALSIDPAGSVYGVAIATDGGYHAVVWQPIPEPGACGVLVAGAVLSVVRWRRRMRPASIVK
jgi:hypothetical protein